ncbi:MAG: hypothetical protein KGS48_02265 [Bacteroidetes bacterium]|nr:hypothetical protein [Bacteroidota bacterium]
MSTKSCFIAFLMMICSFSVFAQREETLLGDRNWGFSGIWGGYTHQYTQFNSREAYNPGGFFVFEFGKALTIGWGHNDLQDRLIWEGTDRNFDIHTNFLKLGYSFIPYKAVHPTLNVDFGRGKMRLGDVNDRVVLIQPAVGVEINVFRWFRLGLEGGYRFVQDSDIPEISDNNLSGPFGQASLRFGFSWGRYHKRNDLRSKTSAE